MALTAQLTHFGVHTTDLNRMVDFYTRVMGFVISDTGVGGTGARIVFMTQNPECHHQFVLFDGRPGDMAYNPVNQISYRLDSLDTLKAYRQKLIAEGITNTASSTTATPGRSTSRIPRATRSSSMSTRPFTRRSPAAARSTSICRTTRFWRKWRPSAKLARPSCRVRCG